MHLISMHRDHHGAYALVRLNRDGTEMLVRAGEILWASNFGWAEVVSVHHDGPRFITRGDGEYHFARSWAGTYNPVETVK